MSLETTPILTAYYLASFRTPAISGGWGAWENDQRRPERTLPNGEREIASVYMPVIGAYDSSDPDVCEYHILLAKAAGLDGFIVQWGADETASGGGHPALQCLLGMAEKLDFKIGLSLQADGFFAGGGGASAREMLSEAMAFAHRHYFSAGAYLHLSGRPMLAIQRGPGAGPDLSATDWEAIRRSQNAELIWIHDFQACGDDFKTAIWDSILPQVTAIQASDSDREFWQQTEKTLKTGRFQFKSGLVTPGFDNRGLVPDQPRVHSRRQGEKYSAVWEDNLNHGAHYIQIHSWNDHLQGTGIEPVKEIILHKNAAVPGWGYRELITTREYAARFTKKKLMPLSALFLPERLFRLRKNNPPAGRGDRIRLYFLEGDVTGAALGLEHAGV